MNTSLLHVSIVNVRKYRTNDRKTDPNIINLTISLHAINYHLQTFELLERNRASSIHYRLTIIIIVIPAAARCCPDCHLTRENAGEREQKSRTIRNRYR